MKKGFFGSKAMWGAILVFIGGGLEAIGVTGAIVWVQNIAMLLGLPLAIIGIRDAQG